MFTSTAPGGRPQGRAALPPDGGYPPRATGGAGRAANPGPAAPSTGLGRVAGGGAAGGPPGSVYRGNRRRPRRGRIFMVLAAGLLALALLGAGGVWVYYKTLSDSVSRTDPFSAITGGRPAKTVNGALNILLLGSDSRDPDNKARAGEWRTDTMILLHIPASHDKAYLVSIPRDLYIHIPQSPTNPKLGNTNAKINAAFAWGGLPLAVQSIEGFTGVRMDHVVLIDFGGFKQVVDALGGIDMNVEQDITSIHPPHRHFKKGVNHFGGAEALDYVRQRYQFADGDFARMRHQQQFMKAVLDKAASGGTLSNPAKLNAFLQSVTKAVTVDKDLSLLDMAVQFRNLRSDALVFMVSPNQGSKTVNGESVVVPDQSKSTSLYEAMKNDKLAEWAGQHITPSASPKRSSTG
jgi:LCP family protein required for cell wall assembly